MYYGCPNVFLVLSFLIRRTCSFPDLKRDFRQHDRRRRMLDFDPGHAGHPPWIHFQVDTLSAGNSDSQPEGEQFIDLLGHLA